MPYVNAVPIDATKPFTVAAVGRLSSTAACIVKCSQQEEQDFAPSFFDSFQFSIIVILDLEDLGDSNGIKAVFLIQP